MCGRIGKPVMNGSVLETAAAIGHETDGHITNYTVGWKG